MLSAGNAMTKFVERMPIMTDFSKKDKSAIITVGLMFRELLLLAMI